VGISPCGHHLDRRRGGDIDKIGHGNAQRRGQTAQQRNAGIGPAGFNVYQHTFADARASRQLIQGDLLFRPVALNARRNGFIDHGGIGARVGRYIDFIGHRSILCFKMVVTGLSNE
jgi:hypothetical protein